MDSCNGIKKKKKKKRKDFIVTMAENKLSGYVVEQNPPTKLDRFKDCISFMCFITYFGKVCSEQ